MVRTTIRHLFRSALLAGMLLLPLLVSSGHAAAAIPRPCEGTGCNDKDPIAMTCDQDAYVAQARTISDPNVGVTYIVQLNYSPKCGTNWANAYILDPTNGGFAISVVLVNEQSQFLEPYTDRSGSGAAYGNMWYAPSEKISACAVVNHSYRDAPGFVDLFCTNAG